MKKFNLRAFTLAEVLITLGIIGIVAALTIPTLLAKYQKTVLKNQFKKTYSILTQNLQRAEYEMGYTPQCYYWVNNPYGNSKCKTYDANGNCTEFSLSDGSPMPSDYNGSDNDCSILLPYFEKNLNVIKKCDNKAYEKGCIPHYKGIDTAYKESNSGASDSDANKAAAGCGNWKENSILNDRSAYVLKDGTILIPFANSSPKLYAIDVNGKKGPNKWGQDLFSVSIGGSKRQFTRIINGPCGSVEGDGITSAEMIKSMNQ